MSVYIRQTQDLNFCHCILSVSKWILSTRVGAPGGSNCRKTSAFIFILKPTWCTNFSNLFLEWNSRCFEEFLCPSSGVFHCTHSKSVWHVPLLCVQWKTRDDGQRNCPKHVEFYSKTKIEELVHLFCFIIRIYHDARSPERQICFYVAAMFRSVLQLRHLPLKFVPRL